MNLSGAMLITKTETVWLQEGVITEINLEKQEIRGYFYLLTSKSLNIDNTSEIYVNNVRFHVKIVMKSAELHPQIMKYRFKAGGRMQDLEKTKKTGVEMIKDHLSHKISESVILYSY